MSYTVKQVAQLSGVSIRTLHFYDEIGLLKPAYYGDNQYRYYEEEQLLLLQQILFFRELGFQLSDIQRVMQSDDFDKVTALQSHKLILEKNLDRTKELIKTIDKTISHLRGRTKMRDVEMYEGFDPVKQSEYETFLLDREILTQQEIDASWERIKDWKQVQWDQSTCENDTTNKALVVALENHLAPDSSEVQVLIRKHYEWITRFWTPTRETYIGLSELYLMHEDFGKYYAAFHPGLLDYLVQGMRVFAMRELK